MSSASEPTPLRASQERHVSRAARIVSAPRWTADEEGDDAPTDADLIAGDSSDAHLATLLDTDGEIDTTVDVGRDTDGPIRLYLQEIGRIALLTAKDEVELAEAYRVGQRAQRELAAGIVNPDDRSRLLAAVAQGQDAERRLVEANLRLVVAVAKRYLGRGMSLLDLIQEGNIGLMRAVDKFDHTRGFKFSTYATWWIRQAITRAIADQSRTIRIPVHMIETITKLIRATRALQQQLGREPTPSEIGHELGLPADKVREIIRFAMKPVSLETPVGEGDDGVLGELIEDKQTLGPSEAATRQLMRDQVGRVLRSLTPRERRVLELRFGIANNGATRTLEEVGNLLGVTRERIRQIEAKALRKLRQPSRRKKLKDFYED